MDKRTLDIITGMPSPILITGAARSGTSLVSGIIHLCGAFGGKLVGPTPSNRKGMFENAAVRNHIVKPFLVSNGWDSMGQNPLPDINALKPVAEGFGPAWRKRVVNIIKGDGYSGGPWFYKGAKMCLLWPIWHAAFPEAKWIIVRRDAFDIAESCLRTSFMRAYKHNSGWLKWVAEHEKRFNEMFEASLDAREVWTQRIIDGDLDQIRTVILHLGLEFQELKVREFIDPSLWNRGRMEVRNGTRG